MLRVSIQTVNTSVIYVSCRDTIDIKGASTLVQCLYRQFSAQNKMHPGICSLAPLSPNLPVDLCFGFRRYRSQMYHNDELLELEQQIYVAWDAKDYTNASNSLKQYQAKIYKNTPTTSPAASSSTSIASSSTTSSTLTTNAANLTRPSSTQLENQFAFAAFEGAKSKTMDQAINQAALGGVVVMESRKNKGIRHPMPIFASVGPIVELWGIAHNPAPSQSPYLLYFFKRFNLRKPRGVWKCAMAILHLRQVHNLGTAGYRKERAGLYTLQLEHWCNFENYEIYEDG
jgi:hypothetical protein